jgi:hypothetical protein
MKGQFTGSLLFLPKGGNFSRFPKVFTPITKVQDGIGFVGFIG